MSTPQRPEDPFGRGQESGRPEDAFGAREGEVTSGDPLFGSQAPPPAQPQGWETPSPQPPPQGWPAPGQQQAGWPPPTQGQWPAPQPRRDTNGKAITALVLGLVGIVFCPLVLSIPAVVFGVIARREVRASQGRETGDGLALAGIIIGILGILWGLLLVAVFVVGLAGTTTTSDDGTFEVEPDFFNVITFGNDALGALAGLL